MMEASLISFVLKMSAITVVVWAFWFTTLKRVNRFSMTRYFLIGGILLSILMPIAIPIMQTKALVSIVNFNSVPSYSIPEVIIGNVESSINWFYIVMVIYLAISGFFALRFVIQIVQIIRLTKIGKQKRYHGMLIIEHTKNVSPFSFLNYCFINPIQIPNDKLDDVLTHELAHYKKLHTADILFVELVGLIQWFNPFYWMLRKALVELHEYQADEAVIASNVNQHEYMDSIVSLAFSGIALSLGNNFNKSLTIKRLAMLSTKKAGKVAIPAIILSSVMAVGIIVTISCSNSPEIDAKDEVVVVAKNLSSSTNDHKNEIIYTTCDEMPVFDNDETNDYIMFRQYLAKNLRYPEEAAKKGVEGRVFISFVVDSEGNVTKVKVAKGVDPSLDNEAIRVTQSSPKWQPGKHEGVAVSTQFTFPIVFVLQ